MDKKGLAVVYWKIITYVLAIALLLWAIFYYTGLKDKSVDLVSSFFGGFR
ncbi:hypothetical protein ACFLZ7_03090 [Nanoarchaeota archaeon]